MGGSAFRTPRPLRSSAHLNPSQDGLGGAGVRTCIGCRERGRRADLVRLIARGERVVVDERASAPGRGAWLHCRSACLEQAVRRRAIGRALRMQGPIDDHAVWTWFGAIERAEHRVE